jgi:uncharacterized CHY-type Zn-finger protein
MTLETINKNTKLAFCGIDCAGCDAYIATQTNNQELKEKTLETWKKQFNAEMTLDAVTCDGCVSGGCHGGYTGECPIRACGMAKGIANCGLCPEYSCEKLDAFVAHIPGGRERLDAARANK